MKFVWQSAMRMRGNTRSYLADVALDFRSVAIVLFRQKAIFVRDLIANADFFFI